MSHAPIPVRGKVDLRSCSATLTSTALAPLEAPKLFMWKRLRRSPLVVLLRVSGVLCLGGALLSATVSAQEGTKRALIIAIGEYGTPPTNPVTGGTLRGYRDLSSANDVVLVRGALERQGFLDRDIRVLADAEATPGGIDAALQRLVRETERGDVVVIHYSGHGHRITNDDPDRDEEIDGLDEVLVPYGAPAEFYEGYDGSLHFRDDQLGEYIAEVRTRAGRTGNVTVFIDACYSGTATRSEAVVRGEVDPLGPPGFRLGQVTVGTRGGGDDERGTGIEIGPSPTTRGGDAGLAPFVVFSAASPRQMAKEVKDVDGRTPVGSLSYALARALAEAGPGTTNRALFASISRSLVGKVSNQTPQMEGDADVALFSNRLTQQLPYVVVDSAATGRVTLAGGTLIGLNPGTRLAVHPLGASPDRAAALATVEVTEAGATHAVARVIGGVANDALRGAWAYVTQRSYGDLSLRVRLDRSLRETDRTGLAARLQESGMMELVAEGGDVVVADRAGRPEARVIADDRVLASGAQQVVAALDDYARNHYLRRLTFESPELDVVLELAPGVEYVDRIDDCTPGDWSGAEARPEHLGGGQWRLAPAALYRVRVRNVGERRAFVYLVDLRPGGEVEVLWPARGRSGEQLEPGREIDRCFQLSAGDLGQEVLKVFATAAPQDLRPWFESERTRSDGSEPDLAVSREVIIDIQPNQENQE